MTAEQRAYWVWLATRPNCGAATEQEVLRAFDSPEAAWRAERDEISAISGMNRKRVDALMDKDLTRANQILQDCQRHHIEIVTMADEAYPAPLRALDDAPLLLYVRGRLPDFAAAPAVAVVGTRRATTYGRRAARYFAGNLAQSGCIVVSGMALGIDGEANRTAIEAGGTTVAVLGCGVDVCYPWEHEQLMEDIIRTGAVISEYPPGSRADGWHFPQRNRIITGLSRGTLVVEAPKQSGALISARLALDQGRDVFAVPGPINEPNSEGCNILIRQGAAELVQTPSDILSHYDRAQADSPAQPEENRPDGAQPAMRAAAPQPGEKPVRRKESPAPMRRLEGTETECTVWRAVKDGNHAVDAIVEHTQLTASKVLQALTMLEVGAYVIREGAAYRVPDDVQP